MSNKFLINSVLFAILMALGVFAVGRFNVSGRTKLFVLIAIAVLALVFLSKTDIGGKIAYALTPKDIDYDCDSTRTSSDLTSQQKTYLEGLARKFYTDIYDTPYLGHDCNLYSEADVLCDVDLQYLAKHYRKFVSGGSSLASDINGEFAPTCSSYLTNLIAHLNKIGEA